jgi:hypothetical protein
VTTFLQIECLGDFVGTVDRKPSVRDLAETKEDLFRMRVSVLKDLHSELKTHQERQQSLTGPELETSLGREKELLATIREINSTL